MGQVFLQGSYQLPSTVFEGIAGALGCLIRDCRGIKIELRSSLVFPVHKAGFWDKLLLPHPPSSLHLRSPIRTLQWALKRSAEIFPSTTRILKQQSPSQLLSLQVMLKVDYTEMTPTANSRVNAFLSSLTWSGKQIQSWYLGRKYFRISAPCWQPFTAGTLMLPKAAQNTNWITP